MLGWTRKSLSIHSSNVLEEVRESPPAKEGRWPTSWQIPGELKGLTGSRWRSISRGAVSPCPITLTALNLGSKRLRSGPHTQILEISKYFSRVLYQLTKDAFTESHSPGDLTGHCCSHNWVLMSKTGGTLVCMWTSSSGISQGFPLHVSVCSELYFVEGPRLH